MKPGRFSAPPPPGDGTTFSEATLWAGDMLVARQPVRMSTVLGSCVAVCLYDRCNRFGGMNHFLVPRGNSTAQHGDWATARLVERMRQLGCRTEDIQAKIFGGGSPLRLQHDVLAVGAENVVIARDVLSRAGIPVAVERVGHHAGLRIFFENWTGVVWLRAHAAAEPPPRSPARREHAVSASS